jgi:hypothetical protein
MSKPKSTKKAATPAKEAKPETTAAPKATAAKASTKEKPAKVRKTPVEELVVFAFRLLPEERDLIHAAAGPAKASKFVRALSVAAARGDEALVKEMLKGINPPK